ncbi:MAG TPA: endopeptidase La [Thermoanaerobaculia bacterium]|nr:endopeptidase La [Thermoanaerobaculia bacterium]
MKEPLTLPVLPFRNAVLFPGVSFPISAGRGGTLRAIDEAMKHPERLIFAVAQRQDVEKVAPEGLYTIGTIASIAQLQRGLGGARLLLQGKKRGIAVRIVERGAMLEAVVVEAAEMEPLDPDAPVFVALHREVRERSAELGRKLGLPDDAVDQILEEVGEPGRLADLVAGYLDIPAADRQHLLETLSVEERLRRVLVSVQKQIAVLSLQEDLKSKVQAEIGDRQREMLLREQMKAIQKELGEGDAKDAEDLKDLRTRLDKLPLPEEARREVEREWTRLARLGRESMESQVARTFLETVADLPWGERSEDHLDVNEAARILDEDHYALKDVKDRVLEFLAVRQLQKAAARDEKAPGKGKILLFAGPPGVGKTSIARSIARAMGRKYVRISLGGARDEADIRGHRRTYVGALPGRILQGMRQAGTKNPVFLLDEIDKLGVSFQGDPAAALLEVLDPAQNDSFTDHYLGVPFDLSEVLFVATANFLQSIPSPLLDRLETVEFSGYTEAEKLAIARQYLVPRQLAENGLEAGQLSIGDDALAAVVSGFTREAGVRQLEREIGRMARKVARRIAAGEVARMEIAAPDVSSILGRPKVHPEKADTEDRVGIATGMYYTPAGGDIMFVEATLMNGKGEVILTGQLGDVMKESARAAWSYARSHAAALGIVEDAGGRDLHVHVPAGAIPKDGPSAGIAMAAAIVSALSKRPARHDLAMTGEITISGRVLPIGGLKEKVLGAIRAGITTVVLPRANEADLEDLPADVRAGLTVHPVDTLEEALALVLRGAALQNGQLLLGTRETGAGDVSH